MSVGREEDAIASLARLHAHGDIHDPFVVNEAAEIKAGVMYDKQAEQGWKKVGLAVTCISLFFLCFPMADCETSFIRPTPYRSSGTSPTSAESLSESCSSSRSR